MSVWKSPDVQVVLSMHPSRVREFAQWLKGSSAPDSRVRSYAEQIAAQGHGAHLAVIDPEDREQVERFGRIVRDLAFKAGDSYPGMGKFADALQAALREFANPTPPRPEEPTGLGAVVVDSNNVTWVLAGRDLTDRHDNWRAHDGSLVGNWRPYSRIDAVTVLSEGVQP